MKIQIEFELEEGQVVPGLNDINDLIRDALLEFMRARVPVDEYILSRYSHSDPMALSEKRARAHRRVQWANAMRQGTFVLSYR